MIRTRIKTHRSLLCRAWRKMERSWWPTVATVVVVLVIAANWR